MCEVYSKLHKLRISLKFLLKSLPPNVLGTAERERHICSSDICTHEYDV